MASKICETGSVPGVRIAAKTIMITIACRLYFRIKLGFSIPSLERKKESIGN